jgi:hypothetical protein
MRQHRPHDVEHLVRGRVRAPGRYVEIPPHHEPGGRAADVLERAHDTETLAEGELADHFPGLGLQGGLAAHERCVALARAGCVR